MINRKELNRLNCTLNCLRWDLGVPTDTITVDTPFTGITEILGEHGTPRLVAQIRQAMRHGEI